MSTDKEINLYMDELRRIIFNMYQKLYFEYGMSKIKANEVVKDIVLVVLEDYK